MPRTGRAAALASLFTLAVAAFTMLAPGSGSAASSPAAITLNPVCGPTGGDPNRYSIDVDGTDFNPILDVLVTFDAGPGGRPESFKTTSDGFGHFHVTITPVQRGAGRYVVRADDFRQREAEAPFAVPCPGKPPPPPTCTASLTLSPSLAPPGAVIALTVSGLPSSVHQLTVAWNRGINNQMGVNIGSLPASVVILPHDLTGPRKLIVVGSDDPSADLSCAAAPFLVLPGSMQPDDFVVRR